MNMFHVPTSRRRFRIRKLELPNAMLFHHGDSAENPGRNTLVSVSGITFLRQNLSSVGSVSNSGQVYEAPALSNELVSTEFISRQKENTSQCFSLKVSQMWGSILRIYYNLHGRHRNIPFICFRRTFHMKLSEDRGQGNRNGKPWQEWGQRFC